MKGTVIQRSIQSALILVLIGALVTGCDTFQIPKDNTTGTTETTTDTPEITEAACTGEFNSFTMSNQYYQVVSMCVGGTSNVGVPPSFQVTVPDYQADFLAYPTWTQYESGNFLMSINKEGGGALLSNAGEDGFKWPWQHDIPCSDYTITGANFLLIDGFVESWWSFSPLCPVEVQRRSSPLPAPVGKVASGSQACQAGEADFDLAVRRIIRRDADQATFWFIPLLTTPASFPERAWLRELVIKDWGAATNLHIGDFATPMTVNGWNLDGTVITPSDPGPTTIKYGVGEKPMTAMLGTSKMPFSRPDMPLPKVHMKWSCQMNGADPHWIPVAHRKGYVLEPPPALPIKSRLVFWIANDGSDMHVAPEGRYLDSMRVKLVASELPGKTFTFPLTGYDGMVTGQLVPNEGSYKIMNGVVTVGKVTHSVPTQMLKPL